MDEDNIAKELASIRISLNLANGLETEVIWSAMNFMKTNCDASIDEAMNYGLNEWIK